MSMSMLTSTPTSTTQPYDHPVFGITQLFLNQTFADAWRDEDPFACALRLSGEVYRDQDNRRTLRFALGGRKYFLKIHRGVGWREIFKNLLHLRRPVVNAGNEWRAIARLHQLGLNTMRVAAYGRRGVNPARQLSFLVTCELHGAISLSELCADWRAHPPPPSLKRALIHQLGRIARTLHDNGVNHRDFYLCHFFIDMQMGAAQLTADNLRLFVIDLHRAQLRRKTPRRWRIKDLAALYFSVLALPLDARDVMRFIRAYTQNDARRFLADRKLRNAIIRRCKRLHWREYGRVAVLPAK